MNGFEEIDIPGIGQRLRAIRSSLSLTQKDFSEKLGIDNNYYATIEREERTPSLKMLVKICSALKISVNELIEIPEISEQTFDDLKGSILENVEKLSPKQLMAVKGFLDNIVPML